MNRVNITKIASWSALVASGAFAPVLSGQPTTYHYNGDPYSVAAAPYALGGNLQGSLEVASPLPPFLPLTDISAAIVDYAFSDGVETRTLANSFTCSFEVATDGTGRITRWQVYLRRSPYNPGDPHHAIDSSGTGFPEGIDSVGTGPAPASPCDPMVLTPAANTSSEGAWTSDHSLPSDPTTYTYTGDPYTTATAPYVVGGNLQGTLLLATPLPPFLPLTDISPWIVSFAFSDDVETRTQANSFVCSFEVATDGTGQITRWQVFLRRSPYNPGDPHHSIESSGLVGFPEGHDLVGIGTAPASPCSPMALSPAANTFSQGTWTSDNGVEPIEVPALGPFGAAVLSLLLAGAGMAGLARNRRASG